MNSDESLKVIAFLFPIFGFILYFSKKDIEPEMGSVLLKYSIFGLIFEVVASLLLFQ